MYKNLPLRQENVSSPVLFRKTFQAGVAATYPCLRPPVAFSFAIGKPTFVFLLIQNDFPYIVKPPCADQTIKHNVVHYIDIFGSPVCAKHLRMAPDRLKIAKMEFQHMLDLGHMSPSSSNYSSPLHMVPKKGSIDCRPVGDLRALNAQTKKDKYPIPNILDFTSELHGIKIFSHIDLVKDFY
ncbi:hypothetical protein AVEN_215607-1 [Araneus ventricosus]|uniref:Retrovirus-related Pol polyprotein from transposon opus n=1 Tax=Araneus ventricosus TaxID=182803 RepID=A0A4Y2S9Q3_ARAVE|nr:hypothetical protein AVEN_215607-1 [Araneus ventricosus]